MNAQPQSNEANETARSLVRTASKLAVICLPRLVRFRNVAFVAVALTALSGCTTSFPQWVHNGFKVGPNYAPPAAPLEAQWIDATDLRLLTGPVEIREWWTVFNDQTLNGLIETAYRQNLDLKTAGQRILEARAQRNIAAGNLFPQSQSADALYAHAQLPDNGALALPSTLNLWATGFNLSWELDFWGRYRRTVEAADADYDARVEDYHDAIVMLLSEVATNYVQMRTYEQRLQFAAQNVEIQKGSTQIAEERFTKGVATELDVRQARSNLRQTESLIPPLVTGRWQAANALCVLLGMPPTDLAIQLGAAPIPKAPAEAAVGIPAELLRRRPDVRKAERKVAAECARIGVAEADLYPRFSIDGFVGVTANQISQLFEPSSFTGIVAPVVQWNILNYGRIINNVHAQDARFQASVLQYQQIGLTSQREVENALVGFLQSQQQAVSLEQGVGETSRSVALVTEQFQGGLTDFNRVYNTESLLVTQQDQLAQTLGNIAANLIEVYRALGGGWQSFDCHSPPHAENVVPSAVSSVKPPEEILAPEKQVPLPLILPAPQDAKSPSPGAAPAKP
ncbi:MAG TPA: efflux transporter outer membrane subunit [Pirellulales bacterium]|jgi:NodT family efflux transporter outer membrane factor (OMF) lipoprotein|nr:efflux transporter outer membrane subunit [Pirellulales bacterium]